MRTRATFEIANSQMEDFCDMEALSRTFSFGGKSLREGIQHFRVALDGTTVGWNTPGVHSGLL